MHHFLILGVLRSIVEELDGITVTLLQHGTVMQSDMQKPVVSLLV